MKIQRAAEKEGVAPREDAIELHKSISFTSLKIHGRPKGQFQSLPVSSAMKLLLIHERAHCISNSFGRANHNKTYVRSNFIFDPLLTALM